MLGGHHALARPRTGTVRPWPTFVLASVAVLARDRVSHARAISPFGGAWRCDRRRGGRGRPRRGRAPFQVPVGPFPAERCLGTDHGRAWRITLAGPRRRHRGGGSSLMRASTWSPPCRSCGFSPRSSLAVAAYALMPFVPLDGARLADRHPAVLAAWVCSWPPSRPRSCSGSPEGGWSPWRPGPRPQPVFRSPGTLT